ncbi:mucin-2-like [Cocos nucifera]|uniref:Mucin-2-like n=1 Tax=Cocos nucifera TaxID=13894 RepID=A0A8K0IKV8_COCNU|nr:mucin-2-like [Cocos nucifera]
MAPKKNIRGRGQRSKTPRHTSASDPNPTATSPSASTPTGDAATASLLPSSNSPSAPPTTTTTTQLIPSLPPLPSLSRRHRRHAAYPPFPIFDPAPEITSLLPSSTPQITATTQPLPSAPLPLLPIRKTHQESISCTSHGTTTTDLAGPSTTPSASAASIDDFMRLFATALEDPTPAVESLNEPTWLRAMVATLFGLRRDDLESVAQYLLEYAKQMREEAEVRAALEALADVEALKSMVQALKMQLAEGKKRDGSGGSCSGSKGAGGGPDSGSGEGGGEGGGVSV